MLVAGFLFLTVILVVDARLMAVGEGIEGLDASALAYPFLLSCDCLLFRMVHGRVGLVNGFVQLGEKARVVLPFARAESALCGGDKTHPVFLTVLDEQAMPF